MPRSGIFWLSIEGLDGRATGAPRFLLSLEGLGGCAAGAPVDSCSRSELRRRPALQRPRLALRLRAEHALVRAREPPALPALDGVLALDRLGARVVLVGLLRRFLEGVEAERARVEALVAQAADQDRDLGPVAEAQERARAFEAEVARRAFLGPVELADVRHEAPVEGRAEGGERRGGDVLALVGRELEELRI